MDETGDRLNRLVHGSPVLSLGCHTAILAALQPRSLAALLPILSRVRLADVRKAKSRRGGGQSARRGMLDESRQSGGSSCLGQAEERVPARRCPLGSSLRHSIWREVVRHIADKAVRREILWMIEGTGAARPWVRTAAARSIRKATAGSPRSVHSASLPAWPRRVQFLCATAADCMHR